MWFWPAEQAQSEAGGVWGQGAEPGVDRRVSVPTTVPEVGKEATGGEVWGKGRNLGRNQLAWNFSESGG